MKRWYRHPLCLQTTRVTTTSSSSSAPYGKNLKWLCVCHVSCRQGVLGHWLSRIQYLVRMVKFCASDLTTSYCPWAITSTFLLGAFSFQFCGYQPAPSLSDL